MTAIEWRKLYCDFCKEETQHINISMCEFERWKCSLCGEYGSATDPKCDICNTPMQQVRPGKWQCREHD